MKKAIVIAIAALLPLITEAAAPLVATPATLPASATPTTAATAMPVAAPPAMPVAAATVAPTTMTNGAVAEPSVDTGSDRLSDLQKRIPLLKAQAEIAELEARIRTATAVNPGATAPATSPSPIVVTRSPNASMSSGIDLLSVRGYKGQYTASLVINGDVVQVSPGDSVDGGWIVSAITGSEVRLTRKGATRVVRM
ncbi:type IV pilus biogenesis protein PilP [Paraburkholderia sp. A1RI-2L]|uniref:type IV pilus biogenesis protein PilP n=1 Tax=Paraburkholderia sp. A1RI-2L TaxID=3028367 RepID=UPI003B79AF7C